MRPIDADALDKVMYHEAFETDSNDQKWDSGCWISYKMFERNLKSAPTITPSSAWVSVKERLPTYAELHEEEVLVLFDGGAIISARFDECMDESDYFGEWKQHYDPETLGATDSEWIPFPDITHWMKKPEPPKEVEDECQ